MCFYGDLSKVASTNRKEGLILSHPENYLGNSLNELRRIGPWSGVAGRHTWRRRQWLTLKIAIYLQSRDHPKSDTHKLTKTKAKQTRYNSVVTNYTGLVYMYVPSHRSLSHSALSHTALSLTQLSLTQLSHTALTHSSLSLTALSLTQLSLTAL